LSYGTDAPLPHYNDLRIEKQDSHFVNVDGDMFFGLVPDIVHTLSQTVDFTYTMSVSKSGIIGELDPNGHGHWTGMVDELWNDNKTDFLAAEILITRRRESVMDFSLPFAYAHLVALAKTGATLDGIKYAVVNDSDDAEFLETNPDPAVKAIWANIQANKPQSLVKNLGDGTTLAQQDGWAFIAYDQAVAALVSGAKVPLSPLGNPLERGFYAFGIKFDSPLRKKLNIGLLRMQEEGTLQPLLTKYGFA